MKLKLLALRWLAATRAAYRQGPPQPELDRHRLPQQRIALVKLDGIGDFVLATGLLRRFQQELPHARVTLFCRDFVAPLARQQFPEWTVVELPARRSVIREILLDHALEKQLKSQPFFDLLLDLRSYRDFGEATLASWIPARQKIALENAHQPARRWVCLPMEQRVYDQRLPRPDYSRQALVQDLQNFDRLEEYFFPARQAGQHLRPHLQVAAEAQRLLAQRLAPELKTPFLLVCPGAGAAIRVYPPLELAQAIASTLAKAPLAVVVAGGKSDAPTNHILATALSQAGVKNLNLTGVLNLAEHVVLMSLAQAVVCMETSHAHIAGALGRPCVAIIGGGHYGWFAPWGESPTSRWLTHRLPCFGCNWQCILDRPHCIQDIPAGLIAKNLGEILALNPAL